MKITIPQPETKQWRGIRPSVYAGHFQQSYNITLERVPGRVSLPGKSQIMIKSDTPSFSIPLKFLFTNADGQTRLWSLTNTRLLHSAGGSATSGWAEDTLAQTPTQNIVDGIIHGDTDHADSDEEDRLLVFLNTDIAILNRVGALNAWDTDWWTAVDSNGGLGQTALKTGEHAVARVQKLIAFGDGNMVHTIDKNDVVAYKRLSFRSGFYPNCIYASTSTFWIGLAQTIEPNGTIVRWDGFSPSFNQEYDIPGQPISGFVARGIPFFINTMGQIMKLTGESFSEFAHFPMLEEKLNFPLGLAAESGIGKYACEVVGNIVKILVAAPPTSKRMRSGVWVLNLDNGDLYHELAIGQNTGDTADYDFGQPMLFRPGGLKYIRGNTPTSDLVVGAGHYASYTGTTAIAIHRFLENIGSGAEPNRGSLVISRIPATGVQDFFQAVWLRFRRFVDANNKIVVKHRVTEPLEDGDGIPLQATMTWLSATQFRGTVPSGIKVDYEAEILAGQNGGQAYTISALSDTNGVAIVTTDGAATVNVTISESATRSDTNASLVRFDNWTEDEIFTDTGLTLANHGFTLMGADTDGGNKNNAEFLDIKIELRGKAMQLEEVLIGGEENTLKVEN